jgi:aryl-alcohol dehydrogenase-like predicted oxidoreductase
MVVSSNPAELVMGSVQLGLAYGAANRTGKPDHATALKLVRRAADAGIATFDTARAYGDAEERLGEALAERPVRTITKLAPLSEFLLDADPQEVCAAVDASIAQSLAALRKPALDCLLLHRASHMHAFGGAVWRRLQEHVAEGRVCALGVSVQSPEEALAALRETLVKHIQLPFNLLDWRWREAGVVDARAQRAGVTVHARSIFLQGLLAAADASLWPRVDGVDPQRIVAWLNGAARKFGRESVADLALSYVRAQPWIDGAVVGMETEAQLDTNLRLATRPVLPAAACAMIEAMRPRVPVTLLDPAQWPKR